MTQTIAVEVSPKKEEHQELLTYRGVTYTTPGFTLEHLKRNDLDAKLHSALCDMLEHVEEQKSLNKRISINKLYKNAKSIMDDLTQKYFNDEITKFNEESVRRKMENPNYAALFASLQTGCRK